MAGDESATVDEPVYVPAGVLTGIQHIADGHTASKAELQAVLKYDTAASTTDDT